MRKIYLAKSFAGIAILLAAPLLVSAQQGEAHIGKLSGNAGAGKQLYYRYCWGCHGFRGDGNGENWLPTGSYASQPYLNSVL
jgi:mono/diheme cytochrome c family protein